MSPPRAGRKLFVLLCVAASTIAPSFGTDAPAGARGISDAGPDASLEYVFDEIEANRLDSALERTEALLRAYPNFRLAHLIQGDLLLARGRPLPGSRPAVRRSAGRHARRRGRCARR